MVRIIPAMGAPLAARASVEHFLAAPRLMHLGVTEPDGTPLVHPVWYTWAPDQFLLHLGTPSRKHRALTTRPVVYFTIDEAGQVGVRGKATATIAPHRDRLRDVLRAQCEHYARPEGSETYRRLFGLLEAGGLVLAFLTPHYLATWGL
jgi:Pyridoxamine 5'-phosphate oxidase